MPSICRCAGRHADDALTQLSGLPRPAELRLDTDDATTDLRIQEVIAAGVRIVRVRSGDDDLVAAIDEMADQRAPAALRSSDLGPVVVAEQQNPHLTAASLSARRLSHIGSSV